MINILNSISILTTSMALVFCMYFINKRLRRLEIGHIANDLAIDELEGADFKLAVKEFRNELDDLKVTVDYQKSTMLIVNLCAKQEQQGILIEKLTNEIKQLEITVLDYKIQVKQLEVKIK